MRACVRACVCLPELGPKQTCIMFRTEAIMLVNNRLTYAFCSSHVVGCGLYICFFNEGGNMIMINVFLMRVET